MSHQSLFARIAAAVLFLAFSAAAATSDATGKPAAERSITQLYREASDAYARKDAAGVYRHCDPSYQAINLEGKAAGLEQNRRELEQSLSKVRSIKSTVETEASELLGNQFFVRYKQTFEIQFPLRNSPSTTWFEAEDTWQQKNGEWRLVSTKVVNDSPSQWKQRLDVQRKQMEFEDEQRRSRRCLNGLGYGCGLPR